jgi:hypothetical protein
MQMHLIGRSTSAMTNCWPRGPVIVQVIAAKVAYKARIAARPKVQETLTKEGLLKAA